MPNAAYLPDPDKWIQTTPASSSSTSSTKKPKARPLTSFKHGLPTPPTSHKRPRISSERERPSSGAGLREGRQSTLMMANMSMNTNTNTPTAASFRRTRPITGPGPGTHVQPYKREGPSSSHIRDRSLSRPIGREHELAHSAHATPEFLPGPSRRPVPRELSRADMIMRRLQSFSSSDTSGTDGEREREAEVPREGKVRGGLTGKVRGVQQAAQSHTARARKESDTDTDADTDTDTDDPLPPPLSPRHSPSKSATKSRTKAIPTPKSTSKSTSKSGYTPPHHSPRVLTQPPLRALASHWRMNGMSRDDIAPGDVLAPWGKSKGWKENEERLKERSEEIGKMRGRRGVGSPGRKKESSLKGIVGRRHAPDLDLLFDDGNGKEKEEGDESESGKGIEKKVGNIKRIESRVPNANAKAKDNAIVHTSANAWPYPFPSKEMQERGVRAIRHRPTGGLDVLFDDGEQDKIELRTALSPIRPNIKRASGPGLAGGSLARSRNSSSLRPVEVDREVHAKLEKRPVDIAPSNDLAPMATIRHFEPASPARSRNVMEKAVKGDMPPPIRTPTKRQISHHQTSSPSPSPRTSSATPRPESGPGHGQLSSPGKTPSNKRPDFKPVEVVETLMTWSLGPGSNPGAKPTADSSSNPNSTSSSKSGSSMQGSCSSPPKSSPNNETQSLAATEHSQSFPNFFSQTLGPRRPFTPASISAPAVTAAAAPPRSDKRSPKPRSGWSAIDPNLTAPSEQSPAPATAPSPCATPTSSNKGKKRARPPPSNRPDEGKQTQTKLQSYGIFREKRPRMSTSGAGGFDMDFADEDELSEEDGGSGDINTTTTPRAGAGAGAGAGPGAGPADVESLGQGAGRRVNMMHVEPPLHPDLRPAGIAAIRSWEVAEEVRAAATATAAAEEMVMEPASRREAKPEAEQGIGAEEEEEELEPPLFAEHTRDQDQDLNQDRRAWSLPYESEPEPEPEPGHGYTSPLRPEPMSEMSSSSLWTTTTGDTGDTGDDDDEVGLEGRVSSATREWWDRLGKEGF